MSESDGVDEVVGGGVRLAITAAGLVGERVAQARAERARQAEAASTDESHRLEARLSAERAAALAQLAQVERAGWWQSASVADVTDVWETAQTWRELDPIAERATERITREVQDRYGVDTDDAAGIDRSLLERVVAERETAAAERQRARQAGEELEAVAVLAADGHAQGSVSRSAENPKTAGERAPADAPTSTRGPDQARGAAAGMRGGGEREVDRRQVELAEALAGITDHEAVEARLLAGLSQGRPAHEAVATPPRSAPKARKPRSGVVSVRQRGIGR